MGVGTPPKGAGHYNQITDDIGLSEKMREPTSIWETLVKVSALHPIKKILSGEDNIFLQAIIDFFALTISFPGNLKGPSWRDQTYYFHDLFLLMTK